MPFSSLEITLDLEQFFCSLDGIHEICGNVTSGRNPLDGLSNWLNAAFDAGTECRDISNANVLRGLRQDPFAFVLDCTATGVSFFTTPPLSSGSLFPNAVTKDLYEDRCRALIGNA